MTAIGSSRAALPERGWLPPLLVLPVLIAHLGYSYGEANHALLLPWILRRADPALLAGDWFANTIPHHLNFVRLMAWLGQWLPLPTAMLVFQVIVWLFLLWTMNRIATLLFADRRVFYVAAFLLIRWGPGGLGGNGLWANYLLPHHAAVPFCLLAFYQALRERPLAAALAAAAATWIHIQLGALAMLVIGIGLLPGWRRLGTRAILLAAAVYAAAAAPTLLPQWALYVAGPSALSPREFLDLHAVLRQPHHLIPSSWPASDYYRFAAVAVLGLLAGGWRGEPHRTVLRWSAAILALCLAGTLFVEVWPVKLIIKLQLFRLTIFVKFFAVLNAARFLLRELEQTGVWKKAGVLAILVVQNFALIGLCTGLILVLRRPRTWLVGASLFVAGVVAGITMVVATSGGIPPALAGFTASPRGLWIAAVTMAAMSAVFWRRPRLLPAALLAVFAIERPIYGWPHFGYEQPEDRPWFRFCRQVRERTPAGAVLLSPPHLGGLQAFAERAEVANFKCAPSIERDLIEWKRRLDDLAGGGLRCRGWEDCGGALRRGYGSLREPQILELAGKYGASYAITSQPGQRLEFPVLYRQEPYVLYRLPP